MMVFAHIRDRFSDAFYPRLSEWFAAVLLMTIGWVLMMNADLMATAKTNTYQLMLLIATQETWSVIMRIFALARLIVLVVNGAWRRSPHLRAICALLTMFFWTQISLSAASTFGLLFAFAAAVLALEFFNMVRAARDARTVDYAHAKGGRAGGHE